MGDGRDHESQGHHPLCPHYPRPDLIPASRLTADRSLQACSSARPSNHPHPHAAPPAESPPRGRCCRGERASGVGGAPAGWGAPAPQAPLQCSPSWPGAMAEGRGVQGRAGSNSSDATCRGKRGDRARDPEAGRVPDQSRDLARATQRSAQLSFRHKIGA